MRSLDAVAAAIIIVMMLRTQALKRDATTKKSKFGLLLAANKSDRELLIRGLRSRSQRSTRFSEMM